MITIISHPDKNDRTKSDMDLHVVSCGYYRVSDRDVITTRPDGRKDFFLYYVAKGKSVYIMDGEERIATTGDVVFYNYLDKQKYTHLDGYDTQIYWIHFNGDRARALLEDLGLTQSMLLHTKANISEYFENIIKELNHKSDLYYKIITGNIYLILANICRKTEPADAKLDHVISLMCDMANNSMSLEDYAALCDLSKSQFIRRFRQYTGQTPINYKNRIIASNARWYLENTTCSISQIAALLGFENVYYFSTMFKKQAGMSPHKYKETAAR